MSALPSPAGVPRPLIDVLAQAEAQLRARGAAGYLVGGLVRDQLLGRPLRYLNADIAVPRGSLALSRALADALGGAYVPLDEAAGTARVVVERDGVRVELDVCDFRAATIEADLALRDFTVNALGVRLEDWLRNPQQPGPVLDPLNGRWALAAHRLSACFPGAFNDDPLRILRAFRFTAQLGFELDPATRALIPASVPRLAGVSGERVRDELFAVFETDQAAPVLRALEQLRALDVLIPELIPGRGLDQGTFHHLNVLDHQLEAVAQADRFLADFAEFSPRLREPLSRYCAERPVEPRSRKALIKLAVLIHDVGKPSKRTVEPDGEIWFIGHEHTGAALAEPIAERLKLSNREVSMVREHVLNHLRPGLLSREPVLTRRAVYRFYKDLGDNGPSCLLGWWADRMATRGSKSRVDQIDQHRAFLEGLLDPYFFQVEEIVKPPRLIDGRQLMAAFGLAPGPVVGRLLAAIEEAQAEGLVQSAEQALELARVTLQTKDPRG